MTDTRQHMGAAGRIARVATRAPKTAEIVADHVRGRIVRGEIKEGDSLPSEGQLIASLGISRPTLREAFRILEAEKLISVSRGSRTGARVHRPRVESAARYAGFVLQVEGTTVADVYAARLAIEPFVARQLADDLPEGAVERLRGEIERLAPLVAEARYIDFMLEGYAFHHLLIEIGGNQTLLLMTAILQDMVGRYEIAYFQRTDLPVDEQRLRATLGIRSFAKLANLIEARDADGAESHWRLHLTNANRAWTEHLEPGARLDTLA